MYNVLPLFKSHYSVGKSILTLEKPTGKDNNYPISIFDLIINNKLTVLPLVDDSISGLFQASKIADENKIKLVFGLRITITDNAEEKNEDSLKKEAKYIILSKNAKGYQDLVKISSFASEVGFYYQPRIDFKNLSRLWNEKNLKLLVPFYDSFLYLNSFESHIHVPVLNFTSPSFILENNSLPMDNYLESKVVNFIKQNKGSVIKAQSIYYKSPEDFISYLAFRCAHDRTTIEKPELNHMGSDEFNFDRWLERNK
jgi:DNA polymerase III alpha subunit